jgi:amidophosphoribosyltransferase
LQEVDREGNVIPSEENKSPEIAPVNGTREEPAAKNAMGNTDGHSEEKRPSQSQDISLHNMNDFN